MGKTGPKPKTREEAWNILCQKARRTMEGCWLIEYGRSIGIGYKSVRADGRDWYVHHLADFMTNGAIPLGLIRRHLCDRPNCINPAHIVRGTHADNVADKIERGRQPKGERNWRSRLTEEDVKAIRLSNKTYAELGKEYNISRGAIHNVKSGRTWSWLK